MPYLIDGHNLIAYLPNIDLDDPHDEAKLVLRLRSWTSRERRIAFVVFDGGLPGGFSRELSSGDMHVVFAARGYTNADRIIKERLHHLPDPGNWTVVSSDREVLDAARDAGARVLSAADFAERLERPPQAEQEKPESISAAEVEAWLEIFGEVADATAPPPIPPAPRERPPRRPGQSVSAQVGRGELPAQPAGEKPADLSADEVDAWLEIFGDAEANPPPPPPPPPPKRKRRPLRVEKDPGRGLAPDEVDGWMELFGEPEVPAAEKPEREFAEPRPRQVQGGQKVQPPEKPRKPKRTPKKLREIKKRVVQVDEDEDSPLSQEDLETWHRLYGDEG